MPTDYINQTIAAIDEKVRGYSASQLKKLKVMYLKNVLNKLYGKVETEEERAELRAFIDSLIELLPKKQGEQKLKYGDYRAYNKEHNKLQRHLRTKYKIVPEGFYLAVCAGVGMCMGIVFGKMLIDTPGVGISLGLVFGAGIGVSLDAKAKKENRMF